MKSAPLRFLLGAGCLLLAACTPAAAEPQPPEIAYGQDLCAGCGMIISDAKFAAALLTSKNEALKFDDIGDMVLYALDHPDTQPKAWFVHDYESETWIRGETAYYVVLPAGNSPMGSGLTAFSDLGAAKAFAVGWNVGLLRFDEMQAWVHETLH